MEGRYAEFLQVADTAMSRGEYLNAIQYALRAAAAPRESQHLRCDAYLVLALAALELDMAEDALSFAVGAHLSACWARDGEREGKASSVVALVVAQHPNLGEEPPIGSIH